MKSDSEQERDVNRESGFVQTCMINLSSLAENYSCDSPGCNEAFIMADNGKKYIKKIRYLNCICHHLIFGDKNGHTLPIRHVRFICIFNLPNKTDREGLLVLRQI